MWKALGGATDKTKPEDAVRDWMSGKMIHHSYDVHHQGLKMIMDRAAGCGGSAWGAPMPGGPGCRPRFLSGEGRDNYARPNACGASSWTAMTSSSRWPTCVVSVVRVEQ